MTSRSHARNVCHKKLIPASDGTTCRIEIDNVPYCSFCRKPYHVEAECFKKHPRLKGHKSRQRASQVNGNRPSKRQHSIDEEDDDAGGPKDPKKPTFMVMKATGEDVNATFGRTVADSWGTPADTLTMMVTRTIPIRDAWIIDNGCAQHVCNNASKFVQMDTYHGPALRSVDAFTYPSGVGTANILCNARGRRRWLILDNVLFVPSAHANLISVLQLLERGAKVEFSSNGAGIWNKTCKKGPYTASKYLGVYALDLWTNLSFPAYHVSPQLTLWHNRLAHLSDANLRRLKKQAHGIRDVEPR